MYKFAEKSVAQFIEYRTDEYFDQLSQEATKITHKIH